jgi:ABC-type multidrug transport system fused ATPase/permease subunit
MADLIVVLDGAHVAEVGTYAELYGLQAAAYR